MLAIAWQYLTGQAVASDPTDRQKAEWPPHPDRVLQAMVAAWGSAGADPAAGRALDWLVSLTAPDIACPLQVSEQSPVKVFVPVNDLVGPASGQYAGNHLKLLPTERPRQKRFFPALNVGDAVCALIWPNVLCVDGHRAAIAQICAQTTHIGHSRSFVRMWATEMPPLVTLRPAEFGADFQLRVPRVGRFDELQRAFGDGGPTWRRPPTAPWQAYARVSGETGARSGEFDARMLVLRRTGGLRVGLGDTTALVSALRGMLIAAVDALPLAKRLISGHEPDGSPLKESHVCIVPLGFVGDPQQRGGAQHADGHLLGLGLLFPRDLDSSTEQELLMGVAIAFRTRSDGRRTLALGQAGTVELAFDPLEAPPLALRPETWARPQHLWGSVTPIALDRSPPRRHANLDAWTVDQIMENCTRQGLPAPAEVAPSAVSPFIGAPHARAYPPLLRKDGSRRWHVHATLRFAQEVAGALVLGAGRYRGYGLMRPLRSPA